MRTHAFWIALGIGVAIAPDLGMLAGVAFLISVRSWVW